MRLCLLLLLACGCDRVFLGEDPGANGFRRRITVTPSSSAPLADFPLSVTTEEDRGLAMHAREDGSDIGFTDADGAPLPFERIAFLEGSLEAWVRVSLQGQTELYMVYGGGEPIAPNPAAVWSDDVLAAYHLDDASDRANDSTRYGNHLSAPADRVPVQQAGAVGQGRAFRDHATMHDTLCAPTNQSFMLGDASLAFSLWINTAHGNPAFGGFDMPLWAGGASASQAGFDIEISTVTFSWNASIADGSAKTQVNLATRPFDRWVHLAVMFDRTAKQVTVYLDGQVETQVSSSLMSQINSEALCLGGPQGYGGMLDEVRVYRGTRPSDWFDAEADNVQMRSTFVTIGDE